MLLTAVCGVYLALLGVVAFEDLPELQRESVSNDFPSEGKFVLRA